MQLKSLVKSKATRDIARKPTENCISEFILIHNHNLAMLVYGTISSKYIHISKTKTLVCIARGKWMDKIHSFGDVC